MTDKKEKQEEKPEDKRVEELTETLKRLQADFENYKKRAAKESCDIVRLASADMIKKILPVLDSFEQAIKNRESKEFVKGVELIFAQLFSVLEEAGLKKIDCEGKCFDPYCQEVLLQQESDKDGIVLAELQKGYTLNGHLVRTSKVKISKKKAEEKNE